MKKVYLNETNWKDECVFFLEPVRNKIMSGLFTRIIYSNEHLSLNGINYLFNINVLTTGNLYNKTVYKFNPHSQSAVLTKLVNIERSVLDTYIETTGSNKTPQHKIGELLSHGSLKTEDRLNTNNNDAPAPPGEMRFCLKLIGVWENECECGLIYKFTRN